MTRALKKGSVQLKRSRRQAPWPNDLLRPMILRLFPIKGQKKRK